MSVYDIVIICLCGTIILLQFVKFLISKKRHTGEGMDIGRCMTIGGREIQEDCFGTLCTGSGVLAVLADGMGKLFGGRIASRIAVQSFIELFQEYNAYDNPQYYFRKAFHCANREILKALENERRGTASVGSVMIRNQYLYYAVVGNVKVCVYREGDLVPVSTGHTVHTLAQERFKEGKISRQEALAMLENHRLFNYLGQDGFRDIEIFDAPVRLKNGDMIALMSDGIYELLSFQEIEAVLSEKGSCQEKALQLIEAVNRHPQTAKDNASVVLIELGKG